MLSRDPALKERYVQDNIAHRGRIRKALENLAENGYLDIAYDNIFEHLGDRLFVPCRRHGIQERKIVFVTRVCRLGASSRPMVIDQPVKRTCLHGPGDIGIEIDCPSGRLCLHTMAAQHTNCA